MSTVELTPGAEVVFNAPQPQALAISDQLFDVQYLMDAAAARVTEMFESDRPMVSTDAHTEIRRLFRLASREIVAIATRAMEEDL